MDTMDTGSKLWMDGHDGYVCYDMTMITADPADRPAAFVRSNCLNIAGRSRRFMRSSSLRHSSQVTLSTAAPAAASYLPTLIHNGLLLHTFTTATAGAAGGMLSKPLPRWGLEHLEHLSRSKQDTISSSNSPPAAAALDTATGNTKANFRNWGGSWLQTVQRGGFDGSLVIVQPLH